MENFLIQCINLYVYSLVGVVKVTYLLRMADVCTYIFRPTMCVIVTLK